MVEAELKTELIAPISAASRAAIINPTKPVGSRLTTAVGKAMSPLVTEPFTMVKSCGYSAKAMMPGNHEQENRQDLQKAGENCAGLGVALVSCGEDALHDDLIGTPIPDAENRCAEENACPRKIGIGDRLYHVEVTGGHHGAQCAEAADFVKPMKVRAIAPASKISVCTRSV